MSVSSSVLYFHCYLKSWISLTSTLWNSMPLYCEEDANKGKWIRIDMNWIFWLQRLARNCCLLPNWWQLAIDLQVELKISRTDSKLNSKLLLYCGALDLALFGGGRCNLGSQASVAVLQTDRMHVPLKIELNCLTVTGISSHSSNERTMTIGSLELKTYCRRHLFSYHHWQIGLIDWLTLSQETTDWCLYFSPLCASAFLPFPLSQCIEIT